MRNFFISIAMIVAVLAVGGGIARHAHLTLDPHHACSHTCAHTHSAAASGAEAAPDADALTARDTRPAADTAPALADDPDHAQEPEPQTRTSNGGGDSNKDAPPGEPCGICLLLATHLLAPDTSPVLTPVCLGPAVRCEPPALHAIASRDVPADARPRAPPVC